MNRSWRALARRACPPAYDALLRWHHRRWLRRETAAGNYVPEPGREVHFDGYQRPPGDPPIPRIWHVTWKTESLPPLFADVHRTIKTLHASPPWTHTIWTDTAIEAFVSRHFPQHREAFASLPRQIMRVDVFRYMVLFIQGGVYCDLDFRLFRPVDTMIADCALLLPAESDSHQSSTFLAQHFLAGVAEHPFWADLIRLSLDQPLDVIRGYGDPVMATGPGFVTRVWRSSPERYRAKIPMRVYFSPPSVLAEFPAEISPLSIGLHDCTGTWRA